MPLSRRPLALIGIALALALAGCASPERSPWEVAGLRAGMPRAELESVVRHEWGEPVRCELPWPPAPACAALTAALRIDGALATLAARADSSGTIVALSITGALARGASERGGLEALAWRTLARWDRTARGAPRPDAPSDGRARVTRWRTPDARWIGEIRFDEDGRPTGLGSIDTFGTLEMERWGRSRVVRAGATRH